MRAGDTGQTRALEWIARLPLCGEPELAELLGVDEHDARRLLHGLIRGGWTETVEPGSPELELRRLAFIREEALPALATAFALKATYVSETVPVRLKDTLDRIGRVEITAGVNGFMAGLASELRRSGLAELIDARSLPLAVSRTARWWPPRTEGYGCLRSGDLWTPFLVAWDRAGAPDLYRRRRVAAWLAARTAMAGRWGVEGLPAILVVCPSERELRVWEQSVVASDEGGYTRYLQVLLATRDQLHAHGPGGPVWRLPGRSQAGLLVERLGWGSAPPATILARGHSLDSLPQAPSRTRRPLREWAATAATAHATLPRSQRLGVLRLGIRADDQRLIGWVARHPLVSSSELTALLAEPKALVERRVERLVQCGAICAATPPSLENAGSRPVNDNPAKRYVLTALGMRLLAAQAGMPPGTFARYGGVTYVDEARPDTAQRAVRHFAHSVGVNHFFAQLAEDARCAGYHLAEWRNEAESTHRFRDAEARAAWIRPDGSGVLARGRTTRSFLLEYDRGTLDAGDYRPKFEGYRRYYAEREWEDDFRHEPVLLFVCRDDRAEDRVVLAARAGAPDVPMLLTSEWRYRRDSHGAMGVLGPSWRAVESNQRLRWLDLPDGEARATESGRDRGDS